jgi:hypothetical protein
LLSLLSAAADAGQTLVLASDPMSDYELFDTSTEIWNLKWVIFAVYLSVTFGFFVAVCLVASHLERATVALVIGLYSPVAAGRFVAIERISTNGLRIAADIRESVDAGQSSLG